MDYETLFYLRGLREEPCILCGRTTRNRGEFVPDDPRKFGVGLPPPGKTRVAIYALCEKHRRNKKILREIERRLASKTN